MSLKKLVHCLFEEIFEENIMIIIRTKVVFYKSLWNSNWRETHLNWLCFYINKILFWITNMTNYYPFFFKVEIAISKWSIRIQYFLSYSRYKDGIFS